MTPPEASGLSGVHCNSTVAGNSLVGLSAAVTRHGDCSQGALSLPSPPAAALGLCPSVEPPPSPAPPSVAAVVDPNLDNETINESSDAETDPLGLLMTIWTFIICLSRPLLIPNILWMLEALPVAPLWQQSTTGMRSHVVLHSFCSRIQSHPFGLLATGLVVISSESCSAEPRAIYIYIYIYKLTAVIYVR